MKWLAGPVFVLAASLSVPAIGAPGALSNQGFMQLSQDQQREGRGGGARDNRGGQDRGGPNRGGPDRGGPSRGAQDRGGPDRGGPDRGRPGPSAQSRPFVPPPRVEHGPRIFEKRAFQRNFDAPRRFRVGIYRAPPGWMYRRWVYGEYLPAPFWARTFWIANFWLYGLDRPPQGCEWVRYGRDALLVDVVTGEILQVVYNLYY